MTERSIVEAAARLRRTAEPYLIATVVAVRGPAYRRPGARMVLTRFRWLAGSVSGGYLEGDLANSGWWHTRDGSALLLSYDAGARTGGAGDDDLRVAFGLGCDGVVDVLLERAGEPGRIDVLELADRCLRGQRRGAAATVYRSSAPAIRAGARIGLVAGGDIEDEVDPIEASVRDRIAADLRGVIETGVTTQRRYATPGGAIDVLLEALLPPPRLFLFGTGHDAVPLVAAARAIGWDVVVAASRAGHAIRDRFASSELALGSLDEVAAQIADADRAVAVVMNHDDDRDRDCLAMLVAGPARYIGVLGPRSRTQRLVPGATADPRVRAPLGLELGADTPQELAVAVVAEIQASLTRTRTLVPAARRRHLASRSITTASWATIES